MLELYSIDKNCSMLNAISQPKVLHYITLVQSAQGNRADDTGKCAFLCKKLLSPL